MFVFVQKEGLNYQFVLWKKQNKEQTGTAKKLRSWLLLLWQKPLVSGAWGTYHSLAENTPEYKAKIPLHYSSKDVNEFGSSCKALPASMIFST